MGWGFCLPCAAAACTCTCACRQLLVQLAAVTTAFELQFWVFDTIFLAGHVIQQIVWLQIGVARARSTQQLAFKHSTPAAACAAVVYGRSLLGRQMGSGAQSTIYQGC